MQGREEGRPVRAETQHTEDVYGSEGLPRYDARISTCPEDGV